MVELVDMGEGTPLLLERPGSSPGLLAAGHGLLSALGCRYTKEPSVENSWMASNRKVGVRYPILYERTYGVALYTYKKKEYRLGCRC